MIFPHGKKLGSARYLMLVNVSTVISYLAIISVVENLFCYLLLLLIIFKETQAENN